MRVDVAREDERTSTFRADTYLPTLTHVGPKARQRLDDTGVKR